MLDLEFKSEQMRTHNLKTKGGFQLWLVLTDPEIFDLFVDSLPLYEKLLSSPKEYIRRIGNQLHTGQVLASHVPIPELIRTIIRDIGLMAALYTRPNRIQRMANMEKLIEI